MIPMISLKQSKATQAKAYTLVELLVVIGVLSVAFSILFVGFGGGDGAKLSSAERTLSGLVKTARAQAILKNAKVRLIIHNNPDVSEIDKYRRLVGIVYFGTDSNDKDGWMATGKGTYLPKGIYFDASASNTESGTNWTIASTMKISFPRLKAQDENETDGTDFLYYEFNNNGTSANPNSYLIFRAGRVIPGTGTSVNLNLPADTEPKSLMRSGLIIRKSGSATLVDDPEDLTI